MKRSKKKKKRVALYLYLLNTDIDIVLFGRVAIYIYICLSKLLTFFLSLFFNFIYLVRFLSISISISVLLSYLLTKLGKQIVSKVGSGGKGGKFAPGLGGKKITTYSRKFVNEDLIEAIETFDLSNDIANMLYGFGEEQIVPKESLQLISEMVS